MEKLKKKQADWSENTLGKHLEEYPEQLEKFTTISGEEVKACYTPEDFSSAEQNYLEEIGFPGQYPFTRGVQPNMYRGRLWTMRQYAGFGSAQESNLRFRYLLEQGQTGLSVAFDLPTQIGYDSDHQMAYGEVGKVGVAIDSLADLECLFEQIPLDKVSTSMTINSPAAVLLAMYIALGEKQGVASDQLIGTIQNDILKEYIARGTYIFPPQPSMRLITDIFSYCSEKVPKFNTISISGYHIREAGSTAAQEVGFTLADAIAYVQAALDKGLDVDDFAYRLSFFFGAHNDLLEEVAKFRAARRLWAKIMKERFQAKNDRSCMLRFHAQTAGCALTAQQPDNNLVRVTIQALAAVLGGTQSLHTNSRDEALALPSEDSVRIALRTQQILAHEAGITQTVDPLAGSYYVEYLTNKIEEKASQYICKIDALGGMVAAIETGYPQHEIQEAAYNYQRSIEESKRIIVGVNKYQSEDKPSESNEKIPIIKIDPSIGEKQIQRLKELKSKRDNYQVHQALENVRQAANSEENIMPSILEAVKVYTTLGEICGVLREVFGEYKENVVI